MNNIVTYDESPEPDQPSGRVPRYDSAIIADNYQPRVEQIAGYLNEQGVVGGAIDSLIVDRANPNVHRRYFNDRVRMALGAGQNLLVINNFFVSARNGYLADLLQAEDQFDLDTKRIIISCFVKDRQRIRAALREYADLVDLVEFDKDNGGADLNQLDLALRGPIISRARQPIVFPREESGERFSIAV